MKPRRNILMFIFNALLLLTMLSVVSCNKGPILSGETEKVPLQFSTPSINPSVVSKAPVEGVNFPNTSTNHPVGLWMMQRGSYTVPQINGFENLKAEYSPSAGGHEEWLYYPFGPDQDYENSIHILKNKDIDIYAYYPWVSTASDLRAIPFISGESDWMIANPIKLDASQTINAVRQTLKFSHLMTCIEVRIHCLYEGNITLDALTLTDSKGRLIASGTFDCTQTDFSKAISGSSVSNIKIATPKSLAGTRVVSTYIIMPPVYDLNLNDKEMKLSFVFNKIQAETEFYLPAEMNVNGSASKTIDKFERGYKYIYNLTLDNTMDFRPVGVEELWNTEEINLPI